MSQTTVNIEFTDGITGKHLGGGRVAVKPIQLIEPYNPGRIISIQYQDNDTGEWKSISSHSDLKGFDIDPTPTDYTINTSREPLTATFSFSSRVIDRRLRVDLVAAHMTPTDVWRFEYLHAISSSYYGHYVFKRYTAQLNHTQPCRKTSWRRLNWKQKARAIAMAEECGWYDDYYYGRA